MKKLAEFIVKKKAWIVAIAAILCVLAGVGTYFVNNTTCGFTGDLVMLDGKPEAKEGRANYPSNRLQKVKYPIY